MSRNNITARPPVPSRNNLYIRGSKLISATGHSYSFKEFIDSIAERRLLDNINEERLNQKLKTKTISIEESQRILNPPAVAVAAAASVESILIITKSNSIDDIDDEGEAEYSPALDMDKNEFEVAIGRKKIKSNSKIKSRNINKNSKVINPIAMDQEPRPVAIARAAAVIASAEINIDCLLYGFLDNNMFSIGNEIKIMVQYNNNIQSPQLLIDLYKSKKSKELIIELFKRYKLNINDINKYSGELSNDRFSSLLQKFEPPIKLITNICKEKLIENPNANSVVNSVAILSKPFVENINNDNDFGLDLYFDPNSSEGDSDPDDKIKPKRVFIDFTMADEVLGSDPEEEY